MRIAAAALAALVMWLAIPTTCPALDYFLRQDLGVKGLYHYCLYSNGKVYTVNATELCPLQLRVDEPPSSNGIGSGNGTMGFYLGEYKDGLTKVCIYNVLGAKRELRLSAVELCPTSYQF